MVVCDGCDKEMIYKGQIEINQSNPDVHDGDVVDLWRCNGCDVDEILPTDFEELPEDEQERLRWQGFSGYSEEEREIMSGAVLVGQQPTT